MSDNVVDKDLWNKLKSNIEKKYGKRWNAYYSGLLVKEYEKMGGRYKGKATTKKNNGLVRWFAEKWENVAPNSGVIVYRPTVRVTKETPVLASQLSKSEIKRKVKEKKTLEGTNKNLTPFKAKRR